jgi:predicted dithiol-disulfide oxidoreductase (DUF899 family)
MGWTFPWASSAPSDFNADYSVSFTAAQQREGIEYNYRRQKPFSWRPGQEGSSERAEAQFAATHGAERPAFNRERPGVSAFVREDSIVYHTYSAYGRGVDAIWGMYQWLDRAPKGRNESGMWWRRHDEYNG